MVAAPTHFHHLETGSSYRDSSPIRRVLHPGQTVIIAMNQGHQIITTGAFPEAMQRLNQFAELPSGWDTYDAKPIAATAIHEARQLLAAIARQFASHSDIAEPFFVAPLPYGGVQIEWRRTNKEIEVEITPDGRFGYLLTTGERENRIFEEKDNVSAKAVLECVTRLCNGD